MIRRLKTIKQIKSECPNYKVTNNGSIKIFYLELKNKLIDHLYIHNDMIKNFGKLIELEYSKGNKYFEYLAVDGWNYSEKWLETNEFLSDEDFMI